ncbi:MAG: hypothetical protein EZS28_029852 [Streblomastix strix]|uniref:peptidylprolyl isomerase n=1 Tax=Streblomastix strix TaxID=222440 RepID=A0A5J4UX14_9EUKA|nr:MAG: hypothetical protein EZS28_029852 [Streblomastix strix]
MKNNDNNKENGKLGWISVFEGLQLHLYGLNIIMDNSQLLIPIIYIQDSNSLLELNTITFIGIKLSPTTEAKGIIHIKYDNSQFIAQSCIFSNINISTQGGNAIRILNSGSYPITSTIKGCQFNNISSIGDSYGRGGSAIYMENKYGSKLIIEQSCQFYKCIIDKGNGGAIYIEIDFASQFEFKINNSTIRECEAKSDISKDVPPTGYGGGIFLTGSGDYDSSTKRLDFKGMKIYGNIADRSGQSLYVVITKLAEWQDGSSEPILVKGDPQSQQTASFKIKDISWFDYDNKHYGIFVSNDRRIFTGVDGSQDQAYPLEVIIEKADIEQEQVDIDQDKDDLSQQLQQSQSLSPFQLPESSSKRVDRSQRWQQQIQVTNPEKDIDPPLTKIPSVRTEQEQSYNSSNQPQQTIIDWGSVQQNNIPSFQNNINNVGQVIRGWDEGFLSMQLGEEAVLTVTGDYAYGEQGFPAWGITPNATLKFAVQILSIN